MEIPRLTPLRAGTPNYSAERSRRVSVILAAGLAGVVASPVGLAAPSCTQPAPLYHVAETQPPGVIVKFRRGVTDPVVAAAALARKLNFRVTRQWAYGGFFVANVTPNLIDALRCEPQVESVTYDAMTSVN